MLKKFKEVILIGFVVCGMGYAGYTLIDPPATASAAQCCVTGTQCGPLQVCCRPDSCTFPCDTQKIGYCLPSCPPPC